MSGLKINFQKSCLLGINMDFQILKERVDVICSKIKNLPSIYLGLPFGATLNSIELWKLVIAKVDRRLTGWKSVYFIYGW